MKTNSSAPGPDVLPGMNWECLEALRPLLAARCRASAAGPDCLQLTRLLGLGTRVAVVRLLVASPLVLHLQELPLGNKGPRRFVPAPNSVLTGCTCLALTDRGAEVAQEHFAEEAGTAQSFQSHVEALLLPLAPPVPFYDAELRTLWLGPHLVKQFLVPARNQELLLGAFQEQNWPSCLDDPLPPTPGIDPKARFAETIKQLNRNQKNPALSFHRRGNGTKAMWQRTKAACADAGG